MSVALISPAMFSCSNRRLRSLFFQVLVPFSLLMLAACGQDGSAPKVSDSKISLNTRRFDRDLAAIDTNHIAAGLRQLQQKYPDFLDFWLDNLMQFNINGQYADTTSGICRDLHTFLTYGDYRGLFDTVARHYPNTEMIDEPLRQGFAYYQHYFPGRSIPRIVYFISGLNNWSAVTVDTSLLGIGLDMFLGEHYPFYRSVGIPDYMLPQLRPEAVPVFAFRALYENLHPFTAEGRSLLDMMIQRGKEQYFLSKVLPFLPEELRLGFSKVQLDWCQKNEAGVYNFFVKGNMLYETNWGKILRYVQDGPTAAGMPPQSPGNVGSWLGFQIVQKYAESHSDQDIQAILSQKDAAALLQQSGYRPR
ncbi:MAG: hypothetical protein JST06_03005 [Bacteroidetes bacterium]|nr:hypothetical protein [Bacteroidota bacterium]MBS1628792.1 hypothetical protein [Bacteroidota bacterium]